MDPVTIGIIVAIAAVVGFVVLKGRKPAVAPQPAPVVAAPVVAAPVVAAPVVADPVAVAAPVVAAAPVAVVPAAAPPVIAPVQTTEEVQYAADLAQFGKTIADQAAAARAAGVGTSAMVLSALGAPTNDVQLAVDQARTDQLRAEQTAQMATAMALGPFDPNALKDVDLYYICRHATEMTFDPRQLGKGPFYGPEVGRMGSQKYGDGSAMFDVVANEGLVNPAVVQVIRDMASRSIKPWMATAFPELASTRWQAEHLTSWYAGWKRLHQGQEP